MLTTNLSLQGAQVACPTSNAQVISSYLKGRSVTIELWLPGGGGIVVDSRVVYVFTHGEECLIGLEFQGLEGNGFRRLRGFLRRRAGADYVSDR